MGYIAIIKQGHKARVSWNTCIRTPDKPYPVRIPLHLGVLSTNGKELLRSTKCSELNREIIDALTKKGIEYLGNTANPPGREPTLLSRVTIQDLNSSKVIYIGVYRLLVALAKESGLKRSLVNAFGSNAEAIFALACHRLDSRQNSYLAKDWGEETPFTATTVNLSPKAVSRITAQVERGRLAFSKSWYEACGKPKKFIEDSTHFCTRATSNTQREIEEYGWKHHQENGLRQINVMSMVAIEVMLPIVCRSYFGSINDISTFMETSVEMDIIGKGTVREYISDSGYFSNFNMIQMLKHGDGFTIEAKWDNQTMRIFVDYKTQLEQPGDTVKHGSFSYRFAKCSYRLKAFGAVPENKCNVAGFIYYSDLEHSIFYNDLQVGVAECEENFYKYDFRDDQQAQEWLDTSTNGIGKYLLIKGTGKSRKVLQNHMAINTDTQKKGFHVILSTNSERSALEVLTTIHGRDPVEKLWHTMKSELDARTLHTKIDDTTQGKIFIVWCASILYNLIFNRMKKYNVKMTMNELFLALRKVKLLLSGEHRTTGLTLTKKSKEAIVAMRLEDKFPEFMRELQPFVEARNKKENPSTKHPGRPARFKFKKEVK